MLPSTATLSPLPHKMGNSALALVGGHMPRPWATDANAEIPPLPASPTGSTIGRHVAGISLRTEMSESRITADAQDCLRLLVLMPLDWRFLRPIVCLLLGGLPNGGRRTSPPAPWPMRARAVTEVAGSGNAAQQFRARASPALCHPPTARFRHHLMYHHQG